MFRRGLIRLQKSTLSEITRLWLAGQPQCTLWHCSSLWSNKTSTSSDDGSSSSSSDSDSDTEKGSGVDQKLKQAAEGVGQSIPGHGQKVQSDLLKQLQSFAKISKDQASGGSPSKSASQISDMLSGMKVQKANVRSADYGDTISEKRRFGQLSAKQMALRRQQSQQDREKVKLFEGSGLGIFTTDNTVQPADKGVPEVAPKQRVSLWERVQQEQLEMFTKQPPSNAFEEMIQWTQEGKLWQFPISNEQGLEEEAKVGFHQHVFLEGQIQDFPRRGPIRHFMELVIIGLAKNPYLSVQQKHEHIDWFRQYFKEKQDILQEALGKDGLLSIAEADPST